MTARETKIQHEYVIKFFTRSEEEGGLGYRETQPNIVTKDLFIPSELGEFIKHANPLVWKALMAKYKKDDKALLEDLTAEIKRRILDSANVATFFNKNKTITFAGESVPLFLVSDSELRGDEDFQKNIFSVVEELPHNPVYDGITILKMRPDVSFFLNGIFIGYMELKSISNGQTARDKGRGKVIGDYLQAVKDIAARKRDTGVTGSPSDTLRIFEKSIHITACDINDTYVIRNIGRYYDDAFKGFYDEDLTINDFRKTIEKEFKLYPIEDPTIKGKRRFEITMTNLYSKKMIEREILFYNFIKYSYKKEKGKWVRSSNRGTLIAPRPKQKFGCDKIITRVQEMLRNEQTPDYYAQRLKQLLLHLHVTPKKIDEILEQRAAYYNNKYVYSILLQYAAGFGKSNIIGWTALQLKNLRFNGEWAYDKIFIVVDRLQLRGQLDKMMQDMNIDKSMFVEAYDQATLLSALAGKKEGSKRNVTGNERIIVVNIQKFLDLREAIKKWPKQMKNMRVAFLIDEIHRSNTGDNNKEMVNIFEQLQKTVAATEEHEGYTKKNIIIGLTATPSDKVLARFGEFKSDEKQIPLWIPFDSYTMKESITDGYTLDPTAHIIPWTKTMQFDLPPGVDPDDDSIKITIAKDDIYANEKRMRINAEFIVNRLVSLVYGKIHGTAKAMLAVTSIPNAINYCNMIRKMYAEKCKEAKYARFKDAPIAIVYSDNQEYESSASMNGGKSEATVIDEFQKAKNGLMIVVDKLQTGFDEPKLHTLFLDKEIQDINAIQTICRVNRITKYKTDCHIVDLSWHNINVKNIKEAYKKYCDTVVSELNPDTELRDLDNTYKDLTETEVCTRWYNGYCAKPDDIDYSLEMEDGIRAWIIEQFKKAAAEEAKRKAEGDETTKVTNEAKRIRKLIGHYGSVLELLDDVYEIDAKYRAPLWLSFWKVYNNVYSSLMKEWAVPHVHPDVDTDDIVPGLTSDDDEDENGGTGTGGGGDGGSSDTPISIIELINHWNDNEELTAEVVQKWNDEIEGMFQSFRNNDDLMAMLRDSNFSDDSKEAEYTKYFKKFLRSLNKRDDLEQAMQLRALLEDNGPQLYDMFINSVITNG